MKKLSIIKNGQVVQTANFENDQAIEDFKEVLAKGESWGKPERWIRDNQNSPLSEEQKAKAIGTRVVEISRATSDAKDAEGNVIPGVPAKTVTEYKFAAEYTLDIKDISADVKTEKDKKDKKEKDRKDRVSSLKAIDWSKIKNFNDAIPILQALVNEHLKDEE